MAADREFVQIDVGADGSCFYRAVYGAARHHPNGGVLEGLYACLMGQGMHNVHEIKKANVARHAADFVNNEDVFVNTIRGYLAGLVAKTDFLTELASGGQNIYQMYHELATSNDPLFEVYIEEASAEFQKEFGNPAEFAELSEADFKGKYATILLDKSSYAAESEYQMVKYLLERCGIYLESVNQANRSVPPKLALERDGRPLLLVRRLLTMEHYAYLMDKAYYEAHKKMVVGPDNDLHALSTWRKNTRTYSTSKLMAEAAKAAAKEEATAAKAAAKEVAAAAKATTKKSKAPAKTKKRNAAIRAKLREMGYNSNVDNANLIQSIRNSLK